MGFDVETNGDWVSDVHSIMHFALFIVFDGLKGGTI